MRTGVLSLFSGEHERALGGEGRVFGLVGEDGAEDGGLAVLDGEGSCGLGDDSVLGLGAGVGLGLGVGVVAVGVFGVGARVGVLGLGAGVGVSWASCLSKSASTRSTILLDGR